MKTSNNLSHDVPTHYRITIQGRLDQQWSTWFDGLAIHNIDNGRSYLEGPIADQPALHGILKRIRDLGLPLLAITQINKPDVDRTD